jgi:hypothetical protein
MYGLSTVIQLTTNRTETPFPIPADWVKGECPHCSLPFAKMAKRQKRD